LEARIAAQRVPQRVDLKVKVIANRIERELQVGPWMHCAVYEDDLKRFWPLDKEDREAKIAEFAKRYGFRLRFYHKGLCAIFDKAVFQFQKRRQLFIHAHNETLSVPPWTSTALVYSCSSWENALLD
jgi:hypothetical protein